MAHSVKLLLGVHAHQPVGNFHEVLEDAHERCYRPFLQTLHGYPQFHFAIHFSGWLLNYLQSHHPADMALLREMVQRGQAELFGGGDTEPVLAVIPARDRVGQVAALSDRLAATLGQRPQGAWLTERVWEATVVPSLADAGISYVTVDDYHFLCTGRSSDEMTGFFTTEEDGRRLDLFPISEALRYRFPFAPAPEAVQYLESLAREGNHAAAIYFDDIEKFGIWPETYEWVYEKGWLVQFIEGVLASPLIQTMRYSDYHGEARTRGVVYLPTTSYIEMNEWTLPAEPANRFADLVEASKHAGRFEQEKAFLRGGIWKNFLSRYHEANWMHKRMLSLSHRLCELPAKQRTPEMLEMLYEAQANDAYWHGLFGGLYLPHLRRAVYRGIVALESMLDRVSPRSGKVREDVDLDGHDELFVSSEQIQAVVKLDGMGALCELDAYGLQHNFADSLRRRVEHYYRKMHVEPQAQHAGSGIASPHDRVSFKHEIRPEDLAPDQLPRSLFIDFWGRPNGGAEPICNYVLNTDEDRAHTVSLGCQVDGVLVRKRIEVTGDRLRVKYHFTGEGEGMFYTELNLAMPSCDGPAGRFILGGKIPGGFGQPLEVDGLKEIDLDDEVLGGKLLLRVNKALHFLSRPHFTVSQSEAGFEKIMQAVQITLGWPLDAKHREIDIDLEIVKHMG